MLKATDIHSTTVRTLVELSQAMSAWDYSVPVVADVETFGLEPKDGKLLGVSLCSVVHPTKPVYVALQWYDFQESLWHVNPNRDQLITFLREELPKVSLVGHNYAYDKTWLEYVLGTPTTWKACTRLMWHMSAAPSGPKSYGLKDGQSELLGWDKRGDVELVEQVEARGGKIKSGGHYLADLEVLARYACLDAASTALLYTHISAFFDRHDYWWMLENMVEYSWLLQDCTAAGIQVDVNKLEEQIETLEHTRAAFSSRFQELLTPHIDRLERYWREDRAAKYTDKAAKERFLSSWDMQKKFKSSSDKDKRELFYDSMKLPVAVETDGGKGSTGVDAIKAAVRESGRTDLGELLDAYEQSESAETLLNSFAKPWLDSIQLGRLHPRFNPCGTVSYRLSGFKPYLLNAPFEEQGLMETLTCDEGWQGVHADFVSAEPAVTAHYSQDPFLLKVLRDGLGDVYLDLAQSLFPQDVELNSYYDTSIPVTSEVKAQFKKQRTVAKVLHLTMQYGGTKYAVCGSLNAAGYATTLAEADALVQAYWRHFRKVAIMNEALHLKNERQGYLRNVVGRVIQVPKGIKIVKRDGSIWEKSIRFKDLPSRFIQSSAHDLLSLWVLKIFRLCKERGIRVKPVIIDCHDSTSNQAPKEQVQMLKQAYLDALTELNEEVRMTVPVKIDVKFFTTLAGLKGEE